MLSLQPHLPCYVGLYRYGLPISPLPLSLSLSLSLSMANHYSLCLIGAMDRLWFHQIILFSQPISLLQSTAQPISESPGYPSSSLSSPPFPDDEISSAISLLPDEEISLFSSPSSPPVIKRDTILFNYC
jgi:hypothetical protein